MPARRVFDRAVVEAAKGRLSCRQAEVEFGLSRALVARVWREAAERDRPRDAFDKLAAETGLSRTELLRRVVAVLGAEPQLLRNLLDL